MDLQKKLVHCVHACRGALRAFQKTKTKENQSVIVHEIRDSPNFISLEGVYCVSCKPCVVETDVQVGACTEIADVY